MELLIEICRGFCKFFHAFPSKNLELSLSIKRISYDHLGPPIFWKLLVLASGNEGEKLQWAEVHARAGRHCTHAKAQGAIQDQATMQPHSNTQVLIKTRIQQCKSQNSARIVVLHWYLNVTDITYMGFNLSGTERLGLGNYEASLDLKRSILFSRQ